MMRIVTVVCATFFLTVGASYAQDAVTPQTAPKADAKAAEAKTADAKAQDPKVKRGQELYATSKCTVCHSIAGKGNAKGPLDDVGTKLKAEEIRQWLINPAEMTGKTKAVRKPPMPPYAKLPKEDLDALIAYLVTLKKG